MGWSKWDIGCCCGACEGGCECEVTDNYTDDFEDGTVDADWVYTSGPPNPIVEQDGRIGVPSIELVNQSGSMERCILLGDMTDKRLYVRFTAGKVDVAGQLRVWLKIYQCVLDGAAPTCEIGADTNVVWNDGTFGVYGYGYGWSECVRNSDSATSDGDYTEPGGANPTSKTFSIEFDWIDSIDNVVQMTIKQDGSTMESSEVTLGNGIAPPEKAVLAVLFNAEGFVIPPSDAGSWIQDLEFGIEDIA